MNGLHTHISTSHWTRHQASKIRALPSNTFPVFEPRHLKPLLPGYHVWDSWFVMDEFGYVADVLGFRVLMALTRPVTDDGGRGERIGYFYTSDGVHYVFGGFLFDTPLFSDVREWSGSTILRRDGRLQSFYTVARGVQLDNVWQTDQRFATAIQTLKMDGAALRVDRTVYHELLAEPDGLYYETAVQASEREAAYPTQHQVSVGSDQVDNFCFRDPKFYMDTRTGKSYLLFEANTGTAFFPAGTVKEQFIGHGNDVLDQITPDDLKANGCVGVYELTNQEFTFGIFHRPWLTSNLVTDEIERINLVPLENALYLFVAAHGNKCTLLSKYPDLQNRDYMLGFRADYLFGPLTPLNGSGVVVQQKSQGGEYSGQEQNLQYVYSWLLVPTNKEGVLDCISYANYSVAENGELQPVKTAGPTVTVQIEGLSSRIIDRKYNILAADAK